MSVEILKLFIYFSEWFLGSFKRFWRFWVLSINLTFEIQIQIIFQTEVHKNFYWIRLNILDDFYQQISIPQSLNLSAVPQIFL